MDPTTQETTAKPLTPADMAALLAAARELFKVRGSRPALPFADRIIRPTQAAEMLGISVAALYDWLAAGTFPQPRTLGAGNGCVGWLESELVTFARNLPLAPGKVGSRRRKAAA